MKMEVKLESAIGKTLESVGFSHDDSQCVLVFTDGTFTTLGAADDGCDGIQELTIEEQKLILFWFGDSQLVEAGIVTHDEIVSMRNDHDATARAAMEARTEEWERREFERLKKKFGDSNGINQGDRNG